MPLSFSCAPVSYPTLSMVRVCLPPLYGSCLPPIFSPSPTSILSFQNMIEFQLQRETPSSTMGFGFFEAGVGSLFVEYFQFCFTLESSVRIVMAHTANVRVQRKMNERGSIPRNEAGGRKIFSGGRLCSSWRPRAQTDETERPTRR